MTTGHANMSSMRRAVSAASGDLRQSEALKLILYPKRKSGVANECMHVPMTAPWLQQQEDGCTAVFVNQVAADVRVPCRCARTPCSEFALVLRCDRRALCRRKRIEVPLVHCVAPAAKITIA